MIIYSPTFTGSVQITGSQTVTGDLTVQGNLTAQTFILSSSVSYFTESFASGSTRFGDSVDDNMIMTGSFKVSGSTGGGFIITGSTGFVGIGTTNPTSSLNVVKSDNSTGTIGSFAANNLSQQTDIWYGGIRMGGTSANIDLNLASKGTGIVGISGAATFDTTGAVNATFNSTNANGGYIQFSRSSVVKGYLGSAAQLLVGGVNDIELRSNANLFLTATTDLKLYSRDTLALTLGASQAATFAGNVGIGTNPTLKLQVYGNTQIDNGYLQVNGLLTTYGNGTNTIQDSNPNDTGSRIGLRVISGTYLAGSDSSSKMIKFESNNNTEIGYIIRNGGATISYVSSSDRRLKEDYKEFNAIDMINRIKIYDFKWKDSDYRGYGAIADELQEVIPSIVSGEKDAMYEDGKIHPQGVDYGKLTPVLLKAIQELKAEIDELKNK